MTDATGLAARYALMLTYAGGIDGIEPGSALGSPLSESLNQGADPLPDVFSALQTQLGLRLEPRKAPVEVMVVDHMERAPTRN